MTPSIPALVLTAGLGTRLDPLTRVRAKPAVPVAGEPLVRRIARWLVASGIREIVCNLHHLPHTVTAALGDGSDLGASIRYSWEQPLVLGSAGGPRQALDIIGADEFFLVNGDTLTDVRLDRVAAAHRQSGAMVTFALVPNREPSRYGGLRLDPEGAVTGFARRGPAAEGSFHFIGVQLVASGVFADIPKGVAANTIGGVYDALLTRQPGAIRGVVVDADFMDIGTVSDYLRTSAMLAVGTADVGARVHTSAAARLEETIVWDDVSIGDGATLEHCIVTDRVHVPRNAAYANAILLNDEHGHLLAIPIPREP